MFGYVLTFIFSLPRKYPLNAPPPLLKTKYYLERREQENIGIQGKELRAEEVREQGNKEKNRTMG